MKDSCNEQRQFGIYPAGGRPSQRQDELTPHLESCGDGRETLGLHNALRSMAAGLSPDNYLPSQELLERLLAMGKMPVNQVSKDDFSDLHLSTVPDQLREALRYVGPVMFPGGEKSPEGEVVEGCWEFGRLEELDVQHREPIVEAIAQEAYEKIGPDLEKHDKVFIVCFTHPVHLCGVRLARKLIEHDHPKENVHAVLATDAHEPDLRCRPGELENTRVIVMVDVIHTGGLLKQLCLACRKRAAREVVGLAIIDQADEQLELPRYSLWFDFPERRTSYAQYINGSAPDTHSFFDRDTSRVRRSLPSGFQDTRTARETIGNRLGSTLARHVVRTGAVKRDARIGGQLYPWVIDILCLLKDPAARTELVQLAVKCLHDLATAGTCVIYSQDKQGRAGVWAKHLAAALNLPLVPVGTHGKDALRVTEEQRRELAKHTRAILVDAAIRTGKNLAVMMHLLRDAEGAPIQEVVPFYALNGLSPDRQEQLQREHRLTIQAVFDFPLSPPIKETVGRYNRKRLAKTLDKLAGLAPAEEHQLWVAFLRQYCKRHMERPRNIHPGQNLKKAEADLQNAQAEGQHGPQVLLRWEKPQRPHPGVLKRLDVEHLLIDPTIRNILYGFVYNSMPPSVIEWSALALASQNVYDWFTKDWLITHQEFFTRRRIHWEFLVGIAYWIKEHGDAGLIEEVRSALREFSDWAQRPDPCPLFPSEEAVAMQGDLNSRCKVLLSVFEENSLRS